MNSNNNQRRPGQPASQGNRGQAQPNRRPGKAQNNTVQTNNNRRAAPAPRTANRGNARHRLPPNKRFPRLSPEERRAPIMARKAERRKKIERIAVFVLLAFILTVVLIVARACRGDVVKREKYQIEDTAPVISADAEDENVRDVLTVTDDGAIGFDEQIESQYAVIIARSDGRIVASREADARIYPASITKIMSLIVAVENAESLDDTITFTTDMISPFYEQGASLAGFAEGETVTLRDMLYGMILNSGADATEGIVRLISGDEKSFVALMNKKATELGLKNTHFVNAVGLHDNDHYSTCNELAVILDYALNNEACKEILCTYKYTTAATEQNPEGIDLTSNLQSRMEGGESEVARIHGGKTGYTKEAGYCLASYAKAYSDGEEYLIVTCKGESLYTPIYDHINACKIYLADQENTEDTTEDAE